MTTDQNLETPGTNPTNPPEGGTNWEVKYKELQTAINNKDQQLQAARKTAEESEAAKKLLEGQVKGVSSESERKIAEASAAKTEAESKAAQLEQEYNDARTKLTTYEKRDAIRDLMKANDKYKLLLLDLEDGTLRVDGLEGDALTAYLDKYAARMGNAASSALEKALEGVVPTTPGGTTASLDLSALEDWVFANPTHKDFQAKYAQYLEAKKPK